MKSLRMTRLQTFVLFFLQSPLLSTNSCDTYYIFMCLCVPQLEKKEVTPPFKPQISDDYGLENFDTQFTNEPVQLTPDDE